MRRIASLILAVCALMAPNFASAQNPPPEKRLAFVIGNAAYQSAPLTTPANDAGLIAQTLQAAGFDVVGARDLDQDSLRRAFRDFVEKAQNAGPDTVVFVYLGGYGLQLEGENYFVPVDARIARDADVPSEALRISDYTRSLTALKLKATIIVLDTARMNPFAQSGQPLAGGLALVDPDPGTLVAFNAAPGTIAPEGPGPYGPYAQALAEMIRDGGLPLADLFERVRLRVNDMTQGAQVPWHVSKIEVPFVFFERGPDAPPPAASPDQIASMTKRPIRDLGPRDAYALVLERDTMDSYLEFVAAYPNDPMARRVRALLAARREALVWRRTRLTDTPPAYWSYLRRYPRGPHVADARRRLAFLSAAFDPPPAFTALEYDVPPPPPDEVEFMDRPVLAFGDPSFGFAPPPPPAIIFLPPPPPDFVVLPPPPPPFGVYFLPIPAYRPVPVWVRPPAYIAPPPPSNVIFTNVHNTVVINPAANTITVTTPGGQPRILPPPGPPAGVKGPPGAPPPAVSVLGPTLPPVVAKKVGPGPVTAPPPAGVVKLPPGGQPPVPPGAKPPGAVTTVTPPGINPQLKQAPKGPTPPPAATLAPPKGAPPPHPPVPPGAKPPGAVTTVTPSGNPPVKQAPPGPNPPATKLAPAVKLAPSGNPPPKPPTPPKPPNAVTTVTPPGGPPKPPPAPPKPPAATTLAPAAAPPKQPPAPPKPPAAPPPTAAVKPPPPAPKKRCPIVNGVENCNVR